VVGFINSCLKAENPSNTENSVPFQAEIARARTEEPRDASQVETLDEGEKEDLVVPQGAEAVAEEQQRKSWWERWRG
jgi:hypothetical protein